jgi:hypothetical protein
MRKKKQFSIAMPEGEVLRASFERHVAMSPDGNHNAYSADNFYIRPLRDLKATKVEGAATTEGDAPFFSPDSWSLGFVLFEPSMRIQRMALSGGAPTNVCRVGSVAGQTWAHDDNIYFVSQMPGGILGVPSSGGQPKEVAKIDFASGEHQHRDPCALPGGKAVVFTVANADTKAFDDAHIAVLSLQTGHEGDNQKQADFLSRSLVKVDPKKLHDAPSPLGCEVCPFPARLQFIDRRRPRRPCRVHRGSVR